MVEKIVTLTIDRQESIVSCGVEKEQWVTYPVAGSVDVSLADVLHAALVFEEVLQQLDHVGHVRSVIGAVRPASGDQLRKVLVITWSSE